MSGKICLVTETTFYTSPFSRTHVLLWPFGDDRDRYMLVAKSAYYKNFGVRCVSLSLPKVTRPSRVMHNGATASPYELHLESDSHDTPSVSCQTCVLPKYACCDPAKTKRPRSKQTAGNYRERLERADFTAERRKMAVRRNQQNVSLTSKRK